MLAALIAAGSLGPSPHRGDPHAADVSSSSIGHPPPMHVHLIHHAADARFAGDLSEAMATHRLERHPSAVGSDLVLVLASRRALADGLGDGPAKAMASGVPVLTTVLGEDVLPPRFPVANKHVPLVRDVAGAMRLLEDHRKNASAHIADGKREVFAHGIFLALLARA